MPPIWNVTPLYVTIFLLGRVNSWKEDGRTPNSVIYAPRNQSDILPEYDTKLAPHMIHAVTYRRTQHPNA